MKRREFLTAASGAGAATAATVAASQPVAAQEERPDFDGFLDDSDGGYEDARGEDEVTVIVGAEGNQGPNAFSPAGLWIDVGTTVNWEWTGDGAHNVRADDGPADFNSGAPEQEDEFSFTFEEEHAGITKYVCDPHIGVNMFGAIAVGDDVPIIDPDDAAAGEIDLHDFGIPFHPHFVGVGAILALSISLVFTFFVLKYGTSPHAKGGSD